MAPMSDPTGTGRRDPGGDGPAPRDSPPRERSPGPLRSAGAMLQDSTPTERSSGPLHSAGAMPQDSAPPERNPGPLHSAGPVPGMYGCR